MAKALGALAKVRTGEEIPLGGETKEELKAKVEQLTKNQAAERVDPNLVLIIEPFKSLWKIDPDIKAALVASMKESGYDEKHPAIVWDREGFLPVILDGHTRREAAIEAGVEMFITRKAFPSEDDAYAYAAFLQINRRNITDSDLFAFAAKNRERIIPGVGKRAERLAALFSISVTKAKNLLTVVDRATEDQASAILRGETPINAVYQAIKEPGEPKKGVNIDPPKEQATGSGFHPETGRGVNIDPLGSPSPEPHTRTPPKEPTKKALASSVVPANEPAFSVVQGVVTTLKTWMKASEEQGFSTGVLNTVSLFGERGLLPRAVCEAIIEEIGKGKQ